MYHPQPLVVSHYQSFFILISSICFLPQAFSTVLYGTDLRSQAALWVINNLLIMVLVMASVDWSEVLGGFFYLPLM